MDSIVTIIDGRYEIMFEPIDYILCVRNETRKLPLVYPWEYLDIEKRLRWDASFSTIIRVRSSKGMLHSGKGDPTIITTNGAAISSLYICRNDLVIADDDTPYCIIVESPGHVMTLSRSESHYELQMTTTTVQIKAKLDMITGDFAPDMYNLRLNCHKYCIASGKPIREDIATMKLLTNARHSGHKLCSMGRCHCEQLNTFTTIRFMFTIITHMIAEYTRADCVHDEARQGTHD
jgi:hypothetical protein